MGNTPSSNSGSGSAAPGHNPFSGLPAPAPAPEPAPAAAPAPAPAPTADTGGASDNPFALFSSPGSSAPTADNYSYDCYCVLVKRPDCGEVRISLTKNSVDGMPSTAYSHAFSDRASDQDKLLGFIRFYVQCDRFFKLLYAKQSIPCGEGNSITPTGAFLFNFNSETFSIGYQKAGFARAKKVVLQLRDMEGLTTVTSESYADGTSLYIYTINPEPFMNKLFEKLKADNLVVSIGSRGPSATDIVNHRRPGSHW